MTTTHRVLVDDDGSFEPRRLTILDGDTVEWTFSGFRDAIVPVDVEDKAVAVRAFNPDDPNEFTGPLPRLISGIHCINQPREVTATSDDSLPAWVWDEPGFNVVYIRLNWQLVNPAPGVYDWSTLDPHMDAAVRSGKYFGTSIRAGVQETPEWLFDARLGDQKCKPIDFSGIKRTIGLPQDQNYQHWWFEVHRALADHVRSNNAWWQRLTAIRLSGANYHSAEAVLPATSGDDPKTADYDMIWEKAGYTPMGLYKFFAAQGDLFLEIFPGKDICYPLIQNGWPRANAEDPTNRIGGVDQTVEILQRGRERWGSSFVVQHLGLQALRSPPNTLPHSGSHPVTSTRGVKVGDGNPNQWALRSGFQGSPTAGQTVNRLHETKDGVEKALMNAFGNSDYVWVELYARDVKPSFDNDSGPIGSLGYTLEAWGDRFTEWRRERWNDELGDPFPMTHSHTFTKTEPGKQKFFYMHGNKEGRGVIVIE